MYWDNGLILILIWASVTLKTLSMRTLGGSFASNTITSTRLSIASGVTVQSDLGVTVSPILGAGVVCCGSVSLPSPSVWAFLLCLFVSFCWANDSLYWKRPFCTICLQAVHSMAMASKSWKAILPTKFSDQ